MQAIFVYSYHQDQPTHSGMSSLLIWKLQLHVYATKLTTGEMKQLLSGIDCFTKPGIENLNPQKILSALFHHGR